MLSEFLPKQWANLVPLVEKIEKKIDEDFLPKSTQVFRALEMPIEEIKVVILGQDPYPSAGFACGLAFSVPQEVSKLPPTLRNILKELQSDINVVAKNGDLSKWQSQGVLLLNRILTLKPGLSLSHANLGWEEFTAEIISVLIERGTLFILWGSHARELEGIIPESQRISSVHPSPLSAYKGFFGSKPFSSINKKLEISGRGPIDWTL